MKSLSAARLLLVLSLLEAELPVHWLITSRLCTATAAAACDLNHMMRRKNQRGCEAPWLNMAILIWSWSRAWAPGPFRARGEGEHTRLRAPRISGHC